MASLLWLTDRSRIEDGRGFCKRYRGLKNHLGSTGYGLQRKAAKFPLMTGSGYHDGLAPPLQWCAENLDTLEKVQAQLATGQAVPDEVVRIGVKAAVDNYMKIVEARGFAYFKDQPATAELLREQCYLVEGLIWCWILEVLPEVLLRGRILEAEHDDTYVFGCTCGLGDGVMDQDAHESRDCEGIGLQCRPDFILETWETKELEYHEFKGVPQDSPSVRDKWEVMMQMFSATLDVERRYGKHVQSIYIHGLIKGKREGEYNPGTGKRDGVQRQQSILCYAYRKAANPPMEPEEWQAQYEWQELDPVDGSTKTRRLGKAYKKTGVWELDASYLTGGIVSRAEWWVKVLPGEIRRKCLMIVGPFSRQTLMVPHFLEETLAEERGWQALTWELYELGQQLLTTRGLETWAQMWQQPEYQAALDRLIPRSYGCRRFGLRYACEMEELCFFREGWADPEGSGRYIPRRPHHRMELEQMIGRGLALPEAGAGEEEEDRE